jgi:hypothetical protein
MLGSWSKSDMDGDDGLGMETPENETLDCSSGTACSGRAALGLDQHHLLAADRDLVARAERGQALDPAAVHEDAVAALQVLDADAVPRDVQDCVPPRHERIVER